MNYIYNKFVDNVAKDLIEQKQLRDEEPEEEEYMETPTEIIKTKKSIEPYNKFVDNVAKDLIEQKQLRDEEPEEEDYIETNEIIPQEENIKRFNNFDDLLNEVMGNMKQQKILKGILL